MKDNKDKNINTPNAETVKQRYTDSLGFMRAVPVILIAIALFLTLCYITADTGAFGRFISNTFMGLFSYMAYTIPVFISLHAICFLSDLRSGKVIKRIIFSAVALTMLSMVAYVITVISSGVMVFDASSYYIDGTNSVGGGVVGSTIAYFLMKLVGRVGLVIILSLTAVVYIIYLASGGGAAFSNFFLKGIAGLVNYGAKLEKRREEKKRLKNEGKEAKYRASDDKRNRDLYNDEYFGTDNGVSRLEIPELGILETKTSHGTAHILRETVIKNTEDDDEQTDRIERDSDASYRKRINEIFVDADAMFVRSENAENGFASGDIVYEPIEQGLDFEVEEPREQTQKTPSAKDYGIDDSADAIFTESFDPYDIAMNERCKDKASSKAEAANSSPKGFSEYIASMTPEEAEHLKRLEAFEESKRRALDRMRAEKEASSPKEAASTEIPGRNDGDNGSDALKKAEEARLREQALLANYGAISNAASEQVREAKSSESISQTASAPSSSEGQYAPRTEVRKESDKYRFVNNTAFEPRIAYSSSAPSVNESSYTVNTPTSPSNVQRADNAYTVNIPTSPSNVQKTDNGYTVSAPVSPSAPSYSTPVNAPRYSAMNEAAAETTKRFSFIEDDGSDVHDIKPSANAKEFHFDSDGIESEDDSESSEAFNEPIAQTVSRVDDFRELEEDDGEMLEVSRSMVEPELDAPIIERSGLDFSFDDEDDTDDADDDEDESFTEDDAEEIIEPEIIPESERNPDVEKYKSMFTIFDGEGEDEAPETDENIDDTEYMPQISEDGTEDEDDAPFDIDEPEDDEPPFVMPAKKIERAEKPEKPKAPKADFSHYKLPPIDLLKASIVEDSDAINREIQFGADQLINTLDSFNIKATIRGMEHGPRITRYSIVPAKGIRVSQIEKLADDIALALAAESIRIEAPIPGKSAVGVEVPNKSPSLVTLRDLLEADEFINDPSKTSVCIGKSVEGSLVYADIGKMPHALIAGATGMGKSVCINALITSMLYKARPDEVKFIMIDPKKVEFAPYTGLPHLLIPVVTDPKQAAGALMWAVDEMNKRYDIIEQVRVKNIDSYNRKVAENPEIGAPMSKIVIFIDELNDLMVQVRDPVENLIMLLAQKSRAAGIHLVIGTQRPSVDVLTGVIKANIPTRIACKVSSGIDSRTILEKTGAEKLIGKGDMLFAFPGKEPKRVQGAFVSDDETEAIVDFIKSQVNGEIYDEQALEDIKRAAQKCDKSKNGDDGFDDDDDEGSGVGYLHDRKFLNAVELAVRNGSVATSFLQRKLHIGYGKAAQYIDIMEDLGIVGEKNGSKARDVLVSMDEWQEKLARLTDEY